MKKIYSLVAMATLIGASAQAQSVSLTEMESNVRHAGMIRGAEQQTADFTSLTKYTPGTTQVLNIRLDYASDSLDYGDSLALTFPAGMTPLAANSSDSVAVTTEGQPGELLNGVNGMTITWGDNDNTYGGIEPGSHVFQVEVQVGSITGDQTVSFFISSDEFSTGAPFETSGSFIIEELPTNPDMILGAGMVDPYFNVTLDQGEMQIGAVIGNIGGELNTATDLDISIAEASYTAAEPLTIPHANGATQTVIHDFTATAVSTHTAIFNVNNSNDFDPSNNMDTLVFNVTDSVLSRTDLSDISGANFSIGAGEPGILGTVFTTDNAMDITSINMVKYASNDANGNGVAAEVRAVIYEVGGTGPGNVIAESDWYMDMNTDGTVANTITFPVTATISAGSAFLVGIEEKADAGMAMAYNGTNYVAGNSWAFFQGNWIDMDANFPGISFCLSVNSGDQGSPNNLNEVNNSAISVYPNPANDFVQILGAAGTEYRVMNLNGQVMTQGTVASDRDVVSTSELASGLYILNVAGENIRLQVTH